MSTERAHSFNVFVIDDQDNPVAGAQIALMVGGEPAVKVTTGSRTDNSRMRGLANTPISVLLPDDTADVRVRVVYAGVIQEQSVDLDAPNLTFRVSAAPPSPPAPSLSRRRRLRGGAAADAPSAPPTTASDPPSARALRPVAVKAHVRLAEIPTSIYDLLLRLGHPLVSVELTNQVGEAFAGSLSAQLLRFSDPQDCNIDLAPNEARTIPLHPVLDRRAIGTLTEIERVTLTIRLDTLSNQTVSREGQSLYLLPRTAAPLSVKDLMTGEWHDLRPYLGGYVTPQARSVQDFLAEVVRHGNGLPLVGYGGPPSGVEAQVRAVYEALRARPLGYVSSTFVFNRHEDWSQQRLRLPSETLATRVANCLDGAVLVASILEAFSLSSALVFTGSGDSAHAFVGWESSRGSDEWSHIETHAFMSMTFEEARASADARAKAFEDESISSRTPIFRRLPIRELRAQKIEALE